MDDDNDNEFSIFNPRNINLEENNPNFQEEDRYSVDIEGSNKENNIENNQKKNVKNNDINSNNKNNVNDFSYENNESLFLEDYMDSAMIDYALDMQKQMKTDNNYYQKSNNNNIFQNQFNNNNNNVFQNQFNKNNNNIFQNQFNKNNNNIFQNEFNNNNNNLFQNQFNNNNNNIFQNQLDNNNNDIFQNQLGSIFQNQIDNNSIFQNQLDNNIIQNQIDNNNFFQNQLDNNIFQNQIDNNNHRIRKKMKKKIIKKKRIVKKNEKGLDLNYNNSNDNNDFQNSNRNNYLNDFQSNNFFQDPIDYNKDSNNNNGNNIIQNPNSNNYPNDFKYNNFFQDPIDYNNDSNNNNGNNIIQNPNSNKNNNIIENDNDKNNNNSFDFNQYIYEDENFDLDTFLENLYLIGKNSKNYSEKIKCFNEIIEWETGNYETRIWTYKSYEQLAYIYCESLDREDFLYALKKLFELKDEVDDYYSIPMMQNIIIILQNPEIIQLSRPLISSVVKLLHETKGTETYYKQLLSFLQETKLFFMEDELKAQFPIDLLLPYITDIKVYNLEVNVIGNEEKQKNIGGHLYTPPINWTSYEFDIYHHYDNGDETWLKCDGNIGEWAIAYHGVARAVRNNIQILQIVENIYKTNLKPGSGQGCCNDININNLTKNNYKICGRGVYLTPNISVAESYSGLLNINGKYYSVVLQFKVNPNCIRISNRNKDYWICEGNTNGVRPYRLLIKERGNNRIIK